MGLFKKKKTATLKNTTLADQIAPMTIEEGQETIHGKTIDYLRIGEFYETTLMAVNLPPEGEVGWLAELYDMPGNISPTLHGELTGTSSALSSLDKSIRKNNRYLNDPNLSASMEEHYKTENKKMRAQIAALLNADGRGFFKVGLTVRLQAESPKALLLLKTRVENKLVGLGITPYVPTGRLIDGLETQLPYLENRLERYTRKGMDSEALATMVPFDSQSFGIRKGFVVGYHPQNKSVKINIDLDSLPNKNMILFGDSGQGKSVTMWELICRLYSKADDIRIIIIDPENEYGASVRKMGGTTITLSNGTNDMINPLQVFVENVNNANEEEQEEEENYRNQRDDFSIHLQNKQEFFRILAPNLDEVVMSYVDDTLAEVYEDFNISSDSNFKEMKATDYPILTDLYNKIEEKLADEQGRFNKLRDFQVILKKYVHGMNKKLFNGYTNVNLNSNLICFNIKDLGTATEMQVAAMSNTIQYIWDLITNNVKETYLFIDEMHVLNNPNSPQSADMIKNIYKRIRKYGNSGAISATQQPADALSVIINGVNYGSAVFDNSIIQILLPMKPKSMQLLRDEASMQFTDEEVKILTIMEHKIGEGLLIYANKKTHVKFELTEEEWRLLGKKPKIVEVA